jgi:hypothetical protein
MYEDECGVQHSAICGYDKLVSFSILYTVRCKLFKPWLTLAKDLCLFVTTGIEYRVASENRASRFIYKRKNINNVLSITGRA